MTWLCTWFDAPNATAQELGRFIDFVDALLQLEDSIELEHADMVRGQLRFLCSDKKARDQFILSLSSVALVGQTPMLIENHLLRPQGPGHGFFSAKAVALGAEPRIWRNEDGTESRITHVSKHSDGSEYKFPDKEYVGKVVGFLWKAK